MISKIKIWWCFHQIIAFRVCWTFLPPGNKPAPLPGLRKTKCLAKIRCEFEIFGRDLDDCRMCQELLSKLFVYVFNNINESTVSYDRDG